MTSQQPAADDPPRLSRVLPARLFLVITHTAVSK